MTSNLDEVTSVKSSNVSLHEKNQRKDKLDGLLSKAAAYNNRGKTAIIRSKSKSKEKLLKNLDSPTDSSEDLPNNKKSTTLQIENSNVEHENYILNKFLDQCPTKEVISVESQSGGLVKAPVPKPRKKKPTPSVTSQLTFNVTSPKMLNSDKSNATYSIDVIGDVLVHESPLRAHIIVKNSTSSKFLEKGDTEVLSDSDKSQKSKDEDNKTGSDIELEKKKLQLAHHENRRIKHKNDSKKDEKCDEGLKRCYTYEKIVEITIYKTDPLQLSSLVVHPVVKIHVIDIATGRYFPKSDKTRSVVFFYENSDNDYILPVMTHAFKLQEKRTLYPSWEENILLNEDFEYLKDESHRIVIFFELLDFLSISTLHQEASSVYPKGWHNIAFAFLKLVGKNGNLNVEKKLRLQLYYPHQSKKNDPQICNVWFWWKKKNLKRYPSTLYVNVKSVFSPTKTVQTFRSKTPIQKEIGSKTKLFDEFEENQTTNADYNEISGGVECVKDTKEETLTWSRNNNEICKVPNKCFVKFKSFDLGCFVLRFSSTGKYLACAVQSKSLFYVVVYSIISLNEVIKFPSHQALIYSLRWFNDDSLLLSASADNTVSIHSLSSCSCFQILPHPSFVYCCDISSEGIIASGCFDGIIRIWNQLHSNKKCEFQLAQELEAHKGYITTLCFNKKSSIYSADSGGIILEWQKEKDYWILKREINLLDLRKTIINQIILFPKEKRLLVHSRDSIIRIIDLKSGCVLQWLRGASNKRFQLFCTISPCGAYVYSGSEDGYVHVWNSKNGQEVAQYIPYSSDHQFLTIHCIHFHPHDNILALCHYGKDLPILVYCFDKNVENSDTDVLIKVNDTYDISKSNNLEEFRLNKIALKGKPSLDRIDQKCDFRAILQKMDLVPLSHKSE